MTPRFWLNCSLLAVCTAISSVAAQQQAAARTNSQAALPKVSREVAAEVLAFERDIEAAVVRGASVSYTRLRRRPSRSRTAMAGQPGANRSASTTGRTGSRRWPNRPMHPACWIR